MRNSGKIFPMLNIQQAKHDAHSAMGIAHSVYLFCIKLNFLAKKIFYMGDGINKKLERVMFLNPVKSLIC